MRPRRPTAVTTQAPVLPGFVVSGYPKLDKPIVFAFCPFERVQMNNRGPLLNGGGQARKRHLNAFKWLGDADRLHPGEGLLVST
jgi:hypothetical protein